MKTTWPVFGGIGQLFTTARLGVVSIAGLVIVHVVVASALTRDGFLSPDSTGYLALAGNLLSGHGYALPDLEHGARLVHFSGQPPLYSLGIAAVAALLPAGSDYLFWASKLFNLFCATAVLVALAAATRPRGWMAGLLLLMPPFLHLFTYTLSEALFIPLLVGFVIVFDGLRGTAEPTLTRALGAGAMCAGMIMTRYIGTFALVALLLTALTVARRSARRARMLCVAAALGMLALIGLAVWNARQGAVAGVRVASMEPAGDLALGTLRSLLVAANPFVRETGSLKRDALALVTGLFEGVLVWRVWRALRGTRGLRAAGSPLARSFFFVGALYLVCIIALRCTVYFDALGFRLLGPGVFCLYVGLLIYAESAFSGPALAAFRQCWLIAAAAGFVLGSPLYLADNAGPSYTAERTRILRRFEGVPSGSIVAFGNIHLNYLRPDIQAVLPRDPPYAPTPETVAQFLDRLRTSRAVHVVAEIHPASEMLTEDRAAFMQQHAGRELVDVR